MHIPPVNENLRKQAIEILKKYFAVVFEDDSVIRFSNSRYFVSVCFCSIYFYDKKQNNSLACYIEYDSDAIKKLNKMIGSNND